MIGQWHPKHSPLQLPRIDKSIENVGWDRDGIGIGMGPYTEVKKHLVNINIPRR